MTIIYLSIYVIVILSVWWLYAVARMHALKFKNFSTHIVPTTNLLMIFLIILSILWFFVIFSIWWNNNNYKNITEPKNDNIEKILNKPEKKEINNKENYKEDIIDNYY